MFSIHIGDTIELYTGSNEWPSEGKVVSVDAATVTITMVDGGIPATIPREAVATDCFGKLDAPRWRVVPTLVIGDPIRSSSGGDTHGCRAAWDGVITNIDGDAAIAVITANTVCSSSWQTGCSEEDREDGDMVGETVEFKLSDCRIDSMGKAVI